jgi:hypothetical protein
MVMLIFVEIVDLSFFWLTRLAIANYYQTCLTCMRHAAADSPVCCGREAQAGAAMPDGVKTPLNRS